MSCGNLLPLRAPHSWASCSCAITHIWLYFVFPPNSRPTLSRSSIGRLLEGGNDLLRNNVCYDFVDLLDVKPLSLFSFLRYWRAILFALVLIVLLSMAGSWGPFPDSQFYLRKVEGAYSTHGYWIMTGAAFLEGLFVLSWYFPGAVLVLRGAVYSAEGLLSLPIVITCGAGGFITAYTIDYALGRKGWVALLSSIGLPTQSPKLRTLIETHGPIAILLAQVHPHSAALASTLCGVFRMSFFRFFLFTTAAVFLWGSFWGILVYAFGRTTLSILSSSWVPWVVVGIWLSLGAIRAWKYKSTKSGQPKSNVSTE